MGSQISEEENKSLNNFLKIDLKLKDSNIQLLYNPRGYFLECAKNIDRNEWCTLERFQSGVGYEIKESNFIINVEYAEGVYVKLSEYDAFVPAKLLIKK